MKVNGSPNQPVYNFAINTRQLETPASVRWLGLIVAYWGLQEAIILPLVNPQPINLRILGDIQHYEFMQNKLGSCSAL